jgi:hypothetical protein
MRCSERRGPSRFRFAVQHYWPAVAELDSLGRCTPMKKNHHPTALNRIRWVCVITGLVLMLGPGLGSKREAVFWMLGGCLLFVVGCICAWVDWRRRRKEKNDAA